MNNTIFSVHHVLSTLSLTHFLCYGSLWGQIRLSRSLPWESTSQFCLRNEELIPLDEVYIIRAFDKHGLKIQYNSADGVYLVIDPYLNGVAVELYVFEEDKLVRTLTYELIHDSNYDLLDNSVHCAIFFEKVVTAIFSDIFSFV